MERKEGRTRKGFVLVSVLLLGTVFISCATAFAWFSRLQIRSALREKTRLENRSMAQILARAAITGLKAQRFFDYDSLNLPWFKPFLLPVEERTWVVQITPLDDKIPLRSVFLPDGSTLRNELRGTWEDLWAELGRNDLAYAVLDFMDKDARPRVGGSERDNHINRYPLDMSELLIVEGMTPETLYGTAEKLGLADYCTLWSGGKINLNVAPVQVMEVLPGLDRYLAERIAESREKEPLKNTDDLRGIPGFPPRAAAALLNLAAFQSQYFSVRIEVIESFGGGASFNVIFDKTSGQITRWEEI
ncbi:MAG: general secretion pathway protein GspK [Synergistaceae bacterium]|jgi:type II secretory pathway component PulK|nr:general secretion pathway protein GspK [Synergistaceae bacterium]